MCVFNLSVVSFQRLRDKRAFEGTISIHWRLTQALHAIVFSCKNSTNSFELLYLKDKGKNIDSAGYEIYSWHLYYQGPSGGLK